MKRIFYNSDGEVVAVNYPNKKYLGGHFVNDETKPIHDDKQVVIGYEQKELTLSDCKIPDFLKGYEYITTEDDLPDHEYTNQMIVKSGSIEVDTDKTKTIMPPKFIKAKELKYQNELIDAELLKASPDPVALTRSQHRIEKLKTMTDSETYEMAIANLSRAPQEKPEIEAKLKSKVAEIKAKG